MLFCCLIPMVHGSALFMSFQSSPQWRNISLFQYQLHTPFIADGALSYLLTSQKELKPNVVLPFERVLQATAPVKVHKHKPRIQLQEGIPRQESFLETVPKNTAQTAIVHTGYDNWWPGPYLHPSILVKHTSTVTKRIYVETEKQSFWRCKNKKHLTIWQPYPM